MDSYDMTVILTVYNQSLEDIEKTLVSIAMQQGCSYQLLVGDDHSKEDRTTEIETLCHGLDIETYRVIRHEQNLKTVGNILRCLEYAEGEYVKAIGSGDTFFSESTLREIVAFCREHEVKVGFGDIVIEGTGERFVAPRNVESFELSENFNSSQRAKLLTHALLWADWIPGGAQFYERRTMTKLLTGLHDDCDVRYCEDFAGILALADLKVYHLPFPILIYDNQNGISTFGDKRSSRKLYDDHLSFYRGMRRLRPLNLSFSLAYALYNARRALALHTPLYSWLQKLMMRSYIKGDRTSDC